MAIRVGELEDSSLRARKICETTQRMIGSPAYFQTYGKPKRIDDLKRSQASALLDLVVQQCLEGHGPIGRAAPGGAQAAH